MLSKVQLVIRICLGVLFVGAGFSHFSELKHDYLAMLPPMVPGGMIMIYFTGLCEMIGGVGIQFSKKRGPMAIALIIFLIAVLPANVNAAIKEIPFGGKPAIALYPRLTAQFILIALLWFSCLKKFNTTTDQEQDNGSS
ncbi:DoxX family membrane protein [bacterium]|nr:DoxX family membrane protein [bacterium]